MHVGWPWAQTLVQEWGTFQTLFVSWQLSNRNSSFVCAREKRNYSVGLAEGFHVFTKSQENRRRSDRCSSLMLRSVVWLLATDVSGQPICLGLHDPWNETDILSRNFGNISSYQSTLGNTPEKRNFHLHLGEAWHHTDDCKSSPFHHRVIIAVHIFFSAARQPNCDPGRLTVQVPRSHTDIHPVARLWTSDHLVAEATHKHTTNTTDEHPQLQRDSNPRF